MASIPIVRLEACFAAKISRVIQNFPLCHNIQLNYPDSSCKTTKQTVIYLISEIYIP